MSEVLYFLSDNEWGNMNVKSVTMKPDLFSNLGIVDVRHTRSSGHNGIDILFFDKVEEVTGLQIMLNRIEGYAKYQVCKRIKTGIGVKIEIVDSGDGYWRVTG